jgi:hypothetical protein
MRHAGPVAFFALVAIVVTTCGSTSPSADGRGDLAAIQALLRTRAEAIGRGDRQAFLATIDPARPTLRRTQQEEFDDPAGSGSLTRSTFKVNALTTYLGYTRAFVEQQLEGPGYAGAFAAAPVNLRRYFRKDAGRWLLSEPTTDELGAERKSDAGDVDLTYWGADEDLAATYVAEAQAAHDFAIRNGPGQATFRYGLAIIPTAGLAGPGWNATVAATTSQTQTRIFPGNFGLDADRREVSAYTRYQLRATAMDQLKSAVLPGLGARLSTHRWLYEGFIFGVTGLDLSATVRQSCAGTPPPTLLQLNEGPPPFGTPGLRADVAGRFYAYAWTLASYLLDTFKKDGYWRLMRAINDGGPGGTPAAFTSALGASEESLYAAGLAWSSKRYC